MVGAGGGIGGGGGVESGGGICGRGGVCGGHGSGDFSNSGGSGSLVDDGVESVDGVSGVLDGTTSAVRLHQAVAALDDVSVAGLVMLLVVSGVGIVHTVREGIFRGTVAVINGFSDDGGGVRSDSRRVQGSRSSVGP